MYKYYNHISMFFRGFARMQPPETIHFNRAFLAKNDGSCFYKVCWVRSSLSSDQHEAGDLLLRLQSCQSSARPERLSASLRTM